MTGADSGATATLQAALAAAADDDTRAWWERYLKGEAEFRGVKMAVTRATVRAIVADPANHLDPDDPDRLLDLAATWFAQRHSEDKLAGVLLLAEHALPALDRDHLDRLAAPLADGSIADWNVCDWYGVKVLGPFVAAGADDGDGDRHGGGGELRARAEAIADWSRVDHLWQRRAGAVAFVDHAATEPELYPGFTDRLVEVCHTNAADDRRWAQTSVGWLLRELSRREPDLVARVVADLPDLSTEARRNATKYLRAG